MDGYSLTEKMRKARRSCRFTAVEQALFYELVAICNGENWATVFDCSNVELCYALDINKNTLIRARESLINAGLIYYQSGKSRRDVSRYSLIKQFDKTIPRTGLNFKPDTGTVIGTDTGTVIGTDSRHLYICKTETESKSKTESKVIPPIPPEGELSEIEKVFDDFRKIYPGRKRGLTTEFNDFKKKHKDYKVVVNFLRPAIEKQIAWRTEKKNRGEFAPEYANLSTWLNQRRWEIELNDTSSPNNQGKSMSEIFRSISK